MTTAAKWPKILPPLTAEQERVSNDFMRHWLEVLPRSFPAIESFNHGFPIRASAPGFRRTLEIGAGLGEHLARERLTPEQEAGYVAVDIRENVVARLRERFPKVDARLGDCQRRLDFPDGWFDRILAIHVLEHLPDLPSAVREMRRVCDAAAGRLHVVIPCEGGLAYGLARKVSAERIFRRRYEMPYDWFISREHLSRPGEILEELEPHFRVVSSSWFPFRVPAVWANLVIGLTLAPRPLASPGSDRVPDGR